MKRLFTFLISIILTLQLLLCTSTLAKETSSFGDMNGDFSVTASDALTVLQASVHKINLTNAQIKYADVDVDKKVSASDALVILQYSVEKILTIPLSDYAPVDSELKVDLTGNTFENGAYEEDVTSDNSFKIATENLQDKTIYTVKTSIFKSNISCFYIDAIHFLVCLQGLINRDYGITHTSLVYVFDDTNSQIELTAADGFWFSYITSTGNEFSGYNIVELNTVDEVIDTFHSQIIDAGLVLWDHNVPATANVAKTICGVDGNLPVRYSTEDCFYTYLLSKLQKYDNTIDEKNLVGLFTGSGKIADTNITSTGSAKCDAYIWACEFYLDRCSSKFMTYTLDFATLLPDNPLNKQSSANNITLQGMYNYDYHIARRCFFVDLNANPYEAPCDDLNQPIGTDYNTLIRILMKRYNRANGNIGQMMGFPPWTIKYTTNHNNSTIPSYDPVASEFLTTSLFTMYNMATEADCAHPASRPNCSVYYKYISRDLDIGQGTPDTSIEYDPDTYYYLIDAGDYDSSIWQLYRVPYIYLDSTHGDISIFWNFNPNNTDRIPAVFDLIYRTRTENDFFSSGDSGAGYVWPVALVQGQKMNTYATSNQIERQLPSAYDKFSEYSKKYYDVLKYDITGFLLDVNYTLKDKGLLDSYNRINPVGAFFQGTDSQDLFMYNGVPYLKKISFSTESSAEDAYYIIIKSRRTSAKFTCLHTQCWMPSTFKQYKEEIQTIAEEKGKKVQYVDVYTFFRLIRESGQAENWIYSNK